jgi:hypothetical protein
MKKDKKVREDILEIAFAGFILGVGFTIFTLKALIDRKKEKAI